MSDVNPVKVLFVCVHNTGRSQMAEAFLNHLAQGRAVAKSAGTIPASSVNLNVVEVMAEAGVDISGAGPMVLTMETAEWADRIITMGCSVGDVCPTALVDEDWGLEDPAGQPLEKVRAIRDQVLRRVSELLAEIHPAGS